MNYSLDRLSEKEKLMVRIHFANAYESCGARTPSQLLSDNHSCVTTDVFEKFFSKHEVAGLISSLENKGIIEIEDRSDERIGFFGNKDTKDLYWLSDDFLSELPYNMDMLFNGKEDERFIAEIQAPNSEDIFYLVDKSLWNEKTKMNVIVSVVNTDLKRAVVFREGEQSYDDLVKYLKSVGIVDVKREEEVLAMKAEAEHQEALNNNSIRR